MSDPNIHFENVHFDEPTYETPPEPKPVEMTFDDLGKPLPEPPLEPEYFEPPPEPEVRNFRVFTGSAVMSDDELRALLPKETPIIRPDVVTDRLPQPAVLSERTIAELGLGKAHVQAANEALVVPSPTSSPLIVQSNPIVENARRNVLARTIAEQEAGREAVARKQAEHDMAKQITLQHNAERLHNNAAADVGDLGYSQPR